MNYQKMMNQAKLYSEMLEVHAKKPQLIAESQLKIKKLQEEIGEIETSSTKEMFNKLNPKRFLFKKSEPVDAGELILRKEIEIRKEEMIIEQLQSARPVDIINMDEVEQECNDILDKQRGVLDKMKNEIISIQSKYNSLLDQYNLELRYYNQFFVTTDKKIISLKQEGFQPRYVGHAPQTILSQMKMDEEIKQGHRRHAQDQSTEAANTALWRE